VKNPIRPDIQHARLSISLLMPLLFLLVGLAAAALVSAQPARGSLLDERSTAALVPIELARLEQPTSILADLQLLRRPYGDTAGALEVLGDPGWQPVGHDVVASPFKPATLWLRGWLRNDSEATLSGAVSVQPWRLQHIDFTVLDPLDGSVLLATPVGLSALQVSGTPSPIFGVRPGMALELPPGSERLVMIRLTDRTISEVSVWLQTPAQATANMQVGLVLQSTLLAVTLTIVVILLLQLRWSFALAAVFLLASTAFELSYERWLLLWIFPSLSNHLIPLFSTTGAIAIVGFSLFSLAMLGAFRHRGLWWLHAGVGTLLIGIGLSTVFIDAHHLARQAITHGGFLLLLIWPLCAWGWRDRTLPYGQILAALLTVCWLATMGRLLIAMTVVAPSTAPMLWLASLLISCATLLAALGMAVVSTRDLRARAARDAALAQEREIGEAFARGIVHDVNNLLTVLSLELHQLEAPADQYTAVQRRDMMATARQVIEQGSIMTRGSLMLSTRDALPLAPVCVEQLLERLAGRMQDTVSPQVRLMHEVISPPPLPLVQTCEVALELSLMNMILNADQAITGRGEIRLQAGLQAFEQAPALDLGTLASRQCLVISVEDTGHGIDPRLRPRLFEPLVSSRCCDGRPCGHGLGLFMVAQFVRNSGAGLRVGPSPEGGARFELLLPLATSEAPRNEITAPDQHQPPLAA